MRVEVEQEEDGRWMAEAHDGEEIGPRMPARIARHAGPAPDDLQADAIAVKVGVKTTKPERQIDQERQSGMRPILT